LGTIKAAMNQYVHHRELEYGNKSFGRFNLDSRRSIEARNEDEDQGGQSLPQKRR